MNDRLILLWQTGLLSWCSMCKSLYIYLSVPKENCPAIQYPYPRLCKPSCAQIKLRYEAWMIETGGGGV